MWVNFPHFSIFLNIWSDKSEELLPQTLLRTVREAYASYGSSKLSSSLKIVIFFSILKIFYFGSIIWAKIMFNHDIIAMFEPRHFY